MADFARGLVEKLFSEQGGALRAFFHRRVRAKSDAADLAQEVYLRMLRVPDAGAIRNPEHYLFTVARNLVNEHRALENRRAQEIDADEPAIQEMLGEIWNIDGDIDAQRRMRRLNDVLPHLTDRCRTVVLLHYRDGLECQDIGARLNISTHMVKKYLAQALALFRRRMARLG